MSEEDRLGTDRRDSVRQDRSTVLRPRNWLAAIHPRLCTVTTEYITAVFISYRVNSNVRVHVCAMAAVL